MYRHILKYGLLSILTAALLTAVFFCVSVTEEAVNTPFSVSSADNKEGRNHSIAIFSDEKGDSHIFIPSYLSLDSTCLNVPESVSLEIGGASIKNGTSCSDFSLESAYTMAVDGIPAGDVFFHQSENVATLYVDTYSGSMDHIHRDKNNSETFDFTLIDAAGVQQHRDETATISGRGNSSWGAAKKGYSISLSKSASFSGMGEGADYILVPGFNDSSCLRNQIAYSMAKHVELPYTPDFCYVDLYLNGVYNGLYLMLTRIEPSESRVDINTAAGDFICEVDLPSRYDRCDNPFYSYLGRVVDITYPKSPSLEQYENVVASVNTMEYVFSKSDSDLAQVIDIESWAKKYVLDEVLQNMDLDRTSAYFFNKDGLVYAGPIWDYDHSIGSCPRNENPNAFTSTDRPYYSALYSNTEFRETVLHQYETLFLPYLQDLISDLPAQFREISSAVHCNSVRWFGGREADFTGIQHHLENRINFLSDAWINGTEYCTVVFAVNERSYDFRYYSFKKGEPLACDYLDLSPTWWHIKETGDHIFPETPVTENLVLVPNKE